MHLNTHVIWKVYITY